MFNRLLQNYFKKIFIFIKVYKIIISSFTNGKLFLTNQLRRNIPGVNFIKTPGMIHVYNFLVSHEQNHLGKNRVS